MAGNKYLRLNGTAIENLAANQASAGAGDAGAIVALDSGGHIDLTMMPTGVGPDVQTITTSEALAAGDLVNVWSSTGAKARKADATAVGKEAMGFVLASVSSGASATVYFEGTITGLSGLTPGKQFLLTTAGTSGSTPPSTAGNVWQCVGFATSTSTLNFQAGTAITV